MQEYVTDTHALLWHLLRNKRLSKKATKIFVSVDEGRARIFIPSIVLVESVYLMEKARIPSRTINRIIQLFEQSPANYSLCQITARTIQALQKLPKDLIPDMPDRIIAATAIELDLPLITKDERIKAAKMADVIW